MMSLVIAIHLIVCLLLIIIVLIQSGRGGGLIDTFSGVESMFGAKTNTFLTRTTTVLAILFFITCLSLAFLSVRQSRSLMRSIKPGTAQQEMSQQLPKQDTVGQESFKEDIPKQEASKSESK